MTSNSLKTTNIAIKNKRLSFKTNKFHLSNEKKFHCAMIKFFILVI